MPDKAFFEERRRRQQDLIAVKKARQNIEALPPEENKEIVPVTVADKAKNFWFYNKFFVIFGTMLAIVLAIVIRQCATREKYDAQVLLFAYSAFTNEQLSTLEYQLEQYYEDLDGNGETNIQIIDCSYAKSDQYNPYQNTVSTKLTANIASNSEALLYIVDEESAKYLEGLFEGGFFAEQMLESGATKTVPVPKSFYKAVEKRTNGMFTLPENLQIGRRLAGEVTIIGKDKNVKTKIKAADKALAKISATK